MDYYDAIMKCTCRYRDMISERTYWDGWVAYESIYKFNQELADQCAAKELSIMKLNRWLGYIQGVLIERGLTTVEDERIWTSSIFEPLDKLMP